LKGTITKESEELLPAPFPYDETFLSCRTTLWAPEMGDIRQIIKPSASSSTLDLVQTQLADVQVSSGGTRLFKRTSSTPKTASGFIGSVVLPFEYLLPAITPREKQNPEGLPPSFTGNNAKIEYILSVVIYHGGFPNKSTRSDPSKTSARISQPRHRIPMVLNVLPKRRYDRLPREQRSGNLTKSAIYRGRMVDTSEEVLVVCKV
jgi:hypothetical protein